MRRAEKSLIHHCSTCRSLGYCYYQNSDEEMVDEIHAIEKGAPVRFVEKVTLKQYTLQRNCNEKNVLIYSIIFKL